MEQKKLERIILLILLLLNGFLLVIVLGEDAARRREEHETRQLLTELLAENGVEVGPEAELLQTAPPPCVVARSFEDEEQRIQGILGDHSSEDLGGSIRFYRSERGQASLRGTGECDLLLTGDWMESSRSREKIAASLFARGGVELDEAGWREEERNNAINLCCCWNGYPVYDAVLRFDFTPGRLDMVSGTLVFSELLSEGAEMPMDSATALTRFVSLAKSEGIICSRLERLSPGYLMSVALSGESNLTPVWRIETDTVNVYLNALTGEQESPEGSLEK
ncbi:MAG: hypothetical protein IJ705_01190 [Oscillospiraceae bacterium]|nr:hypothetical protein [Oscillospiraceae bacterium]